MIDPAEMHQTFKNHVDVMMNVLSVEITALAWKMVNEVMAKELPRQVAVGSLLWNGKDKKKQFYVDVGELPPAKAKKFIGKVAKATRWTSNNKVVILGPKPESKALLFTKLLQDSNQRWSRRDGKVTYLCVGGSSRGFSKGKSAFYTMQRMDNNERKRVKFTSLVSDWKNLP